jgi:hypothetical protein
MRKNAAARQSSTGFADSRGMKLTLTCYLRVAEANLLHLFK